MTRTRDITPIRKPKKQPPTATDLGNARRLIKQHGEDLRYCASLGWLVWDCKRWVSDDTGEAERRAKASATSLFTDAEAAARAGDGAAADHLASWAVKSCSAHKIRDALRLAQSESEVVVRAADLDRDPNLFNAANGTVELRTGKLRDHDREDLLTKLSPVAFDPVATCPRFERFLGEIFAANEELIGFMRRLAGYALTGATTEQVLAFFHGLGANGKSVLMRVLQHVLGDYAMIADFSTFLVSSNDGGPRNDIARLRGARMVSAIEADAGRRLSESMIKQLTGTDAIAARLLYRESFEFVPTFKIILVANHRPVIKGTDHAMWRRLRLVPFDVTFAEDKRDPHLVERLLEESPGVLAWCVRGCLEWQARGLGVPEAVRAATERYRNEQDVLGAFLADECTVSPHARVTASALFGRYSEWCRSNGEEPISQRALAFALTERGFQPERTTKSRLWIGLGLIQPEGDR